jgi:tetratricopeptide (TPR) repeat protein
MKHVWLTVLLSFITLCTTLWGLYKENFPHQKFPTWVIYSIAGVTAVGALLQFSQDMISLELEKNTANLAKGIEPVANMPPKQFEPSQWEKIKSIEQQVQGIQPGQSKLFVSPYVGVKTFYKLGLIAFNQRNFVLAEKYLSSALQAEQTYLPALNLLLQIYQSAAMNHLDDNEPEQALMALNRAEELINQTAETRDQRTWVLIGYVYKSLGQIYEISNPSLSDSYWNKAEQVFEIIASQASTKTERAAAINGLGNFLYQRGQLKKALEKHIEALEIIPGYTAAANDAALVCEGLINKDPENSAMWRQQAVKYWTDAINFSKHDPQFPNEYESKVHSRIQALLSGDIP